MNCVSGDPLENLLYKIFVSLDERTPVHDLCSVLQVDAQLIKNAVSIYCRLRFAQKKNAKDKVELHPSWKPHTPLQHQPSAGPGNGANKYEPHAASCSHIAISSVRVVLSCL